MTPSFFPLSFHLALMENEPLAATPDVLSFPQDSLAAFGLKVLQDGETADFQGFSPSPDEKLRDFLVATQGGTKVYLFSLAQVKLFIDLLKGYEHPNSLILVGLGDWIRVYKMENIPDKPQFVMSLANLDDWKKELSATKSQQPPPVGVKGGTKFDLVFVTEEEQKHAVHQKIENKFNSDNEMMEFLRGQGVTAVQKIGEKKQKHFGAPVQTPSHRLSIQAKKVKGASLPRPTILKSSPPVLKVLEEDSEELNFQKYFLGIGKRLRDFSVATQGGVKVYLFSLDQVGMFCDLLEKYEKPQDLMLVCVDDSISVYKKEKIPDKAQFVLSLADLGHWKKELPTMKSLRPPLVGVKEGTKFELVTVSTAEQQAAVHHKIKENPNSDDVVAELMDKHVIMDYYKLGEEEQGEGSNSAVDSATSGVIPRSHKPSIAKKPLMHKGIQVFKPDDKRPAPRSAALSRVSKLL